MRRLMVFVAVALVALSSSAQIGHETRGVLPNLGGPVSSYGVQIDTFTIAMTAWGTGFMDLTPSVWDSATSQVSPPMRFNREPDTIYRDTDGSTVRWCGIEATDSVVCAWNDTRRMIQHSAPYNAMNVGTNSFNCFWFDFKAKLPLDCKITEAKLAIHYYGNALRSLSGDYEGAYAPLDTMSASAPFLTANTDECGNVWKASSAFSLPDYNSTERWVPEMSNRDDIWDFGIIGAPTYQNTTIFTDVAVSDTVIFDVKTQIQYCLEYDTNNNGFWPHIADGNAQLTTRAGDEASCIGRNPTLYVTYTTENYQGPWNGREHAFAFCTADGRSDNTIMADTVEAHGYRMTMAIPSNMSGMTWAQVRELRSIGHDVQFHGGMNIPTGGFGGMSCTHPADSVSFLLSRHAEISFMDSMGVTPADSNIVFPGYGFPYSGTSAVGVTTLSDMGYGYARTILSRDASFPQFPSWYDDGTCAAQQTDNANFLAPGDTINVFLLSNRATNSFLAPSGASSTQADINSAMHQLFGEAQREGRHLTWLNIHDFDELTADQIGWICDWLDDRPQILVNTFGYFANFYLGNATAVDAPTTARGATATATAADKIFYVWDLE